MYTLDTTTNDLIIDKKIPFVNTISKVTRYDNDSLAEFKLPLEMPALLGTGAEFFLNDSVAHYDDDIIKLNSFILEEKVLVGWIYGGIESNEANIFIQNDGSMSKASSDLWKVYLTKIPKVMTREKKVFNELYSLKVFPNPFEDYLTIELISRFKGEGRITIIDGRGALIREFNEQIHPGRNRFRWKSKGYPAGVYFCRVISGNYARLEKIILAR